MSKEAVIFLLDVGQSMWSPDNANDDGITDLDKAIKCISLMQSQKVSLDRLELFDTTQIIDGRKSDQVALVLMGTPETSNDLALPDSKEYGHITVAKGFDSAKYEMIKYLQDNLPLGNDGADPVDAIVVASDLMISLTAGKAYGTKRIIFFSRFDGPAPLETGLGEIRDRLQGSGLSVDLIDLGASGLDRPCLELLQSTFVDPLDGQVVEIDEALSMLNEYGAKRSRQVATFRGTLDIAADDDNETDDKALKIPVCIFSMSASVKPPSAKKFSSGDSVERSLEYRLVSMEQDTGAAVMPIIQKEKLIKAYRYGKTLVPFTRIDEAAIGYQSEKCLSALGFVPLDSIDRAAFMSSVWLVEAEPGNNMALTAMSALVQACYEKNTAILARYVRAKGNSPKLVALLPKIKASYAGFLMVSLPYAEDLRRFTFPTFETLPDALKPTSEQLDAMKGWIEAMELDGDQLKPSEVPNPTNQRLVQCILSRVRDPACPIPSVEPRIVQNFVAPPPESVARAAPQLERLKNVLVLRKAEKWKHAEIVRFWDITNNELEVQTTSAVPEKSLDDEEKQPTRIISEDRPLENFRAMVTDRHHDLVIPAFKQLMTMIPKFALGNIPLAIECLMALRQVAIREDEHDLFNAYLQELKRSAYAARDELEPDEVSPALVLWQELLKHPDPSAITLISNAENTASLVSPDHAQTFYEA